MMKYEHVKGGRLFAVNESEFRESFLEVSDYHGADAARTILQKGQTVSVIFPAPEATIVLGSDVRLERRTSEGAVTIGHG